MKAPSDLVPGENLHPGLQMAIFTLYPHMVESREEASSLVSLLIRALIPSRGLHPHDLITSQKPHGGLGFQHMD